MGFHGFVGTTGVGSFLLQEIDDMGQNHQHPKMDDSILKTILIFNHPRPSARLWSFPAHGATPAIGRGAFVTGVLESMKLRGWDGTEVFSLDGHVHFRN